ncbi:MAG: type 3 dihydrofolate reductase [Gammaproteobacteria bacterium]|nr:type 3 dihydrofolate reductase [Gammaproteobacteria bacterium]
MIVSIIAAMDRKRLIGVDNQLPWRLPADLRHFKRVTMGKPILMGRRTWASIGRPLPGRENIVVTRDDDFRAEGCSVVHSLDGALTVADHYSEVMVIGGASFYAQMLPRSSRMYLTLIDHEFVGDTYFPDYGPAGWRELGREDCSPDDRNRYHYSFVVLERA